MTCLTNCETMSVQSGLSNKHCLDCQNLKVPASVLDSPKCKRICGIIYKNSKNQIESFLLFCSFALNNQAFAQNNENFAGT